MHALQSYAALRTRLARRGFSAIRNTTKNSA